MEQLRIEARRERLDLLGRKGVAADLGGLADADVLKVFHFAALSTLAAVSRRANIGFTVRVITSAPVESVSSNRNLTKPISGRRREGRVSSTVARAVTDSPARSGLSQRTSSIPGAPRKLDWPMKPS